MNRKFILKAAIVAVAALFLIGVAKNLLIQSVLAASISRAAHVPVGIGHTDASFLKSSIRVKDIRVKNPPGFKEKLMLHAPLIAIHFDVPAFFKGSAHFQEIRLDLKEVVVVKNAQGKLNIDAMKPREEEKKKRKKAREEKAKGKAPKLMIDKLYLTIGRVVYKDYSSGAKEPVVQTFDINIKDRLYAKIDNPSGIISLIMVEALTRTTLSRLADFDVSIFKDGALGAVSGGLGAVGDGADALENTAKGIAGLFQ